MSTRTARAAQNHGEPMPEAIQPGECDSVRMGLEPADSEQYDAQPMGKAKKGKALKRYTNSQMLAGEDAERHKGQMDALLAKGRAISAENRERVRLQKVGKPGIFNPDKYRCWMMGNGQNGRT